MRRAAVWMALASGFALLWGCNPKSKARAQQSVEQLKVKASEAGQSVSSGLSSSWESTKTAAPRWLEAAQSVDSAMNGCTMEVRQKYELGAAEEYYIGRSLAAEYVASFGGAGLKPEHPVAQYVDRVGQFVALASEVYGEANERERWKDFKEKALPNRPWPYAGYHFIVIERAEPNAFGGPGGAVIVTTGLLAMLQGEDELAAVLAHEVAHVQRGHGTEIVKAFICQAAEKEQMMAPVNDLKSTFASLDIKALDGFMELANEKMKAVYTVGYPREWELESDRIGIRYLELAGYDPDAMVRVFERLKAAKHDDYAQTHPTFEKRVTIVKPVLASIPKEKRPQPADVALREARFREAMAKLPVPVAAR